jgi:hypothetical protein
MNDYTLSPADVRLLALLRRDLNEEAETIVRMALGNAYMRGQIDATKESSRAIKDRLLTRSA